MCPPWWTRHRPYMVIKRLSRPLCVDCAHIDACWGELNNLEGKQMQCSARWCATVKTPCFRANVKQYLHITCLFYLAWRTRRVGLSPRAMCLGCFQPRGGDNRDFQTASDLGGTIHLLCCTLPSAAGGEGSALRSAVSSNTITLTFHSLSHRTSG